MNKWLVFASIFMAVLISGCLSQVPQEIKSCGSQDLISMLPGDSDNLNMVTIGGDVATICSSLETRLKSLAPKMEKFAYASYQWENNGLFDVAIIGYDNSNDAREYAEFQVNEVVRNWNVNIQNHGQNEIVWALVDGKFHATFWNSGNHLVTIDNKGATSLHTGLLSDLLAKYPSDNDLTLPN